MVHLAFDGMVISGLFMFFTAGIFWLLYLKRKGTIPTGKWLLWCFVLSGFCGFLAVELGWISTEEGRQPWIIYNLMRVSSAVTPNPWMTVSLIIFSFIYLVLGATLIILLILLARRRPPVQTWSELIVTEPQEPTRLEPIT